jgi:hypothetical protein
MRQPDNLPAFCRVHRNGRPLIGYLLTCARTGAWRGSVQVPGPLLCFRLPALVVWLSSGLRGSGAATMGEERLKTGLLALLEVAVPASPFIGNGRAREYGHGSGSHRHGSA